MSWLFDYINKLQRLPLEEKKRKAKIIASFLTLIVFIFWLSTISLKENKESMQNVNIDVTPLKNIQSAFGEIVGNIINFKNTFEGIRGTSTKDNNF